VSPTYEAEFIPKVIRKLEEAGYRVVERSPIPYENFWREVFEDFVKSSKKCWFDLVVTHTQHTNGLIGVECKTNGDLGSMHSAIGRCLDYLTVKGVESAIIVFPPLEARRRKRLESLISKFGLPIKLMEI
jgi:hypothetical protein